MKAFSLPLTCFLLLSFSITSFSQWKIRGDGSEFRESRTVPAFTKLSLALHAEVVIVKGNSPGVRIEGEKNIIEKLITEVGDNELKIYFPLLKDIQPTKPLRIWVTTPDEIRGIWNSGSGIIRSDEIFTGSDFSLHLSGSGKIIAGVKADAVSVSMSGSGGVELTGTTKQLSCGISGSGRVHADELNVTEHAKAHISGSGSIYFTTDGAIEGRISGSGCINYKGNPSSVDVHHSGSGRARKVA